MNHLKRTITLIREIITKFSPTTGAVLLYVAKMKKIPNLKNPKNFAEKVNWLKLNTYADSILVSECADKYAVRDYVAKKGFGNILNDYYGIYDSYDDIDFESLPDSFALKVTHGCGYNIIVDNKVELDLDAVAVRVSGWMRQRYGYASAEMHYTKIKPRVLIEKNMKKSDGSLPLEYKIFCFNGEPRVVQVSSDSANPVNRNYFDIDWHELDYSIPAYRNKEPMEKPENLNELIDIARGLSGDFPFVRVDLYADTEEVVFGELTFTPAAGCPPIMSELSLSEMGKMLDIKDSAAMSL